MKHNLKNTSSSKLSLVELEPKPKPHLFDVNKGEAKSLMPVSEFEANSNFNAVVLHQLEDASFEIVLVHPLPEHSVSIAHYEDDYDVIADWRFIAARLNLPLFSMSPTGALKVFSGHQANPHLTRRFGSPLSGRRTRFAGRRKMGMMN
jgi:Family of unknown function (DUF6101)